MSVPVFIIFVIVIIVLFCSITRKRRLAHPPPRNLNTNTTSTATTTVTNTQNTAYSMNQTLINLPLQMFMDLNQQLPTRLDNMPPPRTTHPTLSNPQPLIPCKTTPCTIFFWQRSPSTISGITMDTACPPIRKLTESDSKLVSAVYLMSHA